MAWPFIRATDVTLSKVDADAKGFWLSVNGYEDTRCDYAATREHDEELGRAATYPAGKIVVHVGGTDVEVASLDEAKAALAKVLNAEGTHVGE